MIQVKAIHIEEFRGIRALDLDMDNKPFVVFGPNGSGKSGVVDAIDFALTGNISRLSGAGTGSVSINRHAPHVHQRDNPSAATVVLTFTHADTGQVGTLTRSVATPGQATLVPNTPELQTVVAWAAEHPELVLSRREVIKYVNTEPGKRAQEVQALLKLDRIDEVRRLLKTANNKTSSAASSARDAVTSAEEAIRRHLDVASLLESLVLASVNTHRRTLGLAELTHIDAQTDLSGEVVKDDDGGALHKASALRDIDTLTNFLEQHDDLDRHAAELTAALRALEDNPTIFDALRHRHLVEAGLPLVTDPACPLCDTAWPDKAALEHHLTEKLARSEAAAELERRTQRAAHGISQQLGRARELIRIASAHAATLASSEVVEACNKWALDLASFETRLSSLELARHEMTRLSTDVLALPPEVVAGARRLRDAVTAVPDRTAADSAKTFLSIAHDRWQRLQQARSAHAKAAAAQKTSSTVYAHYNTVADEALTILYTTVENDFSNFYRELNSDDESAFKAGLSPTAGKLDLKVDFYGLGMFPPMAYHSEGHQDGMGVCLYLALIRQLLASDFRMAVLDDVVTSVDANHRRQFCRLLQSTFPDVQFIMTTHDEVWARQMQSSGLIARRSVARFYGWTVDGGPLYGQQGDFWTQIENDLAADDVPGAAHKLRRNLEAALADLTASLHGQVVFRPDNNYDLSAFFSAVKSRYGDILKKAAASASSWNNETAKEQVQALKANRTSAILAQDGENWAINALVHNNDWATMSKADFVPVVDASKAFLDLHTCSNSACDGWIYVVGQPGSEEAARCSCGTFNLNLVKK